MVFSERKVKYVPNGRARFSFFFSREAFFGVAKPTNWRAGRPGFGRAGPRRATAQRDRSRPRRRARRCAGGTRRSRRDSRGPRGRETRARRRALSFERAAYGRDFGNRKRSAHTLSFSLSLSRPREARADKARSVCAHVCRRRQLGDFVDSLCPIHLSQIASLV